MRKLILVLVVLVAIAVSASAQAAPKGGEFGVQGSLIFTQASATLTAQSVGVKYYFTPNIAARLGLGVFNQNGGGVSDTVYDLGAGFEYHFGSKGGVSPYAGAELSYSGESVSPSATTPNNFGIAAVVGGEYFFSSNFSWAGEARLGFSSFNSAASVNTTLIGTFGFATFLTWYLT